MSPPKERLWEAVYNGLRQRIDQRELGPGSVLPTEQELVEQYGVGRGTVRQALQRLEAHGLITQAHGPQGRKVREFAPLMWNLSRFELGERRDDPDTGRDEWAADMREQGREPTETVQVDPLPAPSDIASYLNVEPETWLIRRRRYRYADGELVSIADTWLPDEVAKLPATYRDQRIYPFMAKDSIALPGGLIRAVGIIQRAVQHIHFARNPTPDEANLLGISASTSVAEVVIIGYDDNDQRFRVMVTVSPGDKLAAQYFLKVGASE